MKLRDKLPYFLVLALILLASCIYLFAGIQKNAVVIQGGNYPQGYYMRTKKAGPVRIIPLAGNNLKSPPANDPGAIYSPFDDGEQKESLSLQKLETY